MADVRCDLGLLRLDEASVRERRRFLTFTRSCSPLEAFALCEKPTDHADAPTLKQGVVFAG
jgi:hypothetical protein